MLNFKQELVKILNKTLPLEREEIEKLIETPSDTSMGDLALPCFILAKTMKKSPAVIAEELAKTIDAKPYFDRWEATGPYLNFFYAPSVLMDTLVETIEAHGIEYGKSDEGKDKTVIVEYSSPNIAKPFHIGHIRSTLIGDALYRIAQRLGYNAVGINHLGDYGTQFGMLISAYKKWGNKEAIEANPIDEFLQLYVRYNKEGESDPSLREEAHQWFKKLEENDEEAKKIWQWMRDLSLREFEKVYNRLNIHFDSYNGEAFYQDKMPEVIQELKDKKLLVEDDGCEIVDLEPYQLTPLIIQKSNGTTTYATRDIAAAIYRKKTYDFHKNIYVVATEQNLHFKQWFKTIELMGYEWAKDLVHAAFGMVSMEGMSLSTRKGQVLYLEDVLNKAVEKTLELIEDRNPDLPEKVLVSEQVGIGAIKFQELYNQRIKDYVFNWDRTLSFEGETGPYVQYTYARTNSLIEKSGVKPKYDHLNSQLLTDEEITLLKLIYEIPEIIHESFVKYEPYFISRQIMEVAKAFNRYYYNCPILVDDEKTKLHRLAMVAMVKAVIKSQLSLLGIETPERM
ncbi:MAG: arginine--tRNA ligase [Tissierellia bacterium]|nr:arginine--tRNA ligase [Tissierellia bacterium]